METLFKGGHYLRNFGKWYFLYIHKQICSKLPILSYFVEPKWPSGNFYVSCFLWCGKLNSQFSIQGSLKKSWRDSGALCNVVAKLAQPMHFWVLLLNDVSVTSHCSALLCGILKPQIISHIIIQTAIRVQSRTKSLCSLAYAKKILQYIFFSD